MNKLKRTDSPENYLKGPYTILDDFEQQEKFLLEEIAQLNALISNKRFKLEDDIEELKRNFRKEVVQINKQVKKKYKRLNDLQIESAVKKREIKIRRDTRELLPFLENTVKASTEIKNDILNNITVDFDEIAKFSASDILNTLCSSNSNISENGSN